MNLMIWQESSELLTEAFENPESTPVHLPRQMEDKSSIIRFKTIAIKLLQARGTKETKILRSMLRIKTLIMNLFAILSQCSEWTLFNDQRIIWIFIQTFRRAIGELGSKDSTKPGKDRRETQCWLFHLKVNNYLSNLSTIISVFWHSWNGKISGVFSF